MGSRLHIPPVIERPLKIRNCLKSRIDPAKGRPPGEGYLHFSHCLPSPKFNQPMLQCCAAIAMLATDHLARPIGGDH